MLFLVSMSCLLAVSAVLYCMSVRPVLFILPTVAIMFLTFASMRSMSFLKDRMTATKDRGDRDLTQEKYLLVAVRCWTYDLACVVAVSALLAILSVSPGASAVLALATVSIIVCRAGLHRIQDRVSNDHV